MNRPQKRSNSLRPFVRHLSEVAASLPTTDEIVKAKAALDEIVTFLEELRRTLDALPSLESAGSVRTSIDFFDQLLDKAESNPALALAFGVTPKQARRAAPAHQSEDEEHRGRVLFDQLVDLTIDQVRERLVSDAAVRLSDLRALASHLHVRYQSKSTRESLAQTLTARIANSRGYDALSSSKELSDEEQNRSL